jgi:hypothetical protein
MQKDRPAEGRKQAFGKGLASDTSATTDVSVTDFLTAEEIETVEADPFLTVTDIVEYRR